MQKEIVKKNPFAFFAARATASLGSKNTNPWAEPLPVAVTPSPARRKPGEGQPGSPRALIQCPEFGEIIKRKSLPQLLWHKGKAIKWPFLFQPL